MPGCRHTGEEKERSGTDWDSVIYQDLPSMDLSGKKVAFFGCGDSQSYGDYFCDAVGELHDQFSATGATLIGASWSHFPVLNSLLSCPYLTA